MNDDLLTFAFNVHSMYESYRIAGFDKDQSFKLTCDFARTLVTVSANAQVGVLYGIYRSPHNRLRRAEGNRRYQLVMVACLQSGANRSGRVPDCADHVHSDRRERLQN